MSLLRLSLTLLILTHFSCLESTCEAAEGSEAGGVRRSNGQCHQQVFKDCCFVVTRIHYYERTYNMFRTSIAVSMDHTLND